MRDFLEIYYLVSIPVSTYFLATYIPAQYGREGFHNWMGSLLVSIWLGWLCVPLVCYGLITGRNKR
jgi:hypothetical protein